MSHNHDDNLFHSEVELSAWERLQVPKKLDLNQGTHASAEAWTLANETLSPKSAAAHVWCAPSPARYSQPRETRLTPPLTLPAPEL